MRVEKWVDFGQNVTVEIGMDDIRAALAECFEVVTRDRLGESGPNRADILRALSSISSFLEALTDKQIGMLTDSQKAVIHDFLREQATRFAGSRP